MMAIKNKKDNNTEGEEKEFSIYKLKKTTPYDAGNNPTRLLNNIGKWYSQLEIEKVNLQLQEDQLEDAIVYEEEGPDKCKHLIDKIASLQN